MDLAAAVAELKRSTDTFGRLIGEQAARIPDQPALKFERETVTYGAYDAEVNRLAALLARSGVGRGTPVAILCQNSPRFLTALGAVAKLGAIGALLNTHLDGAGLTHVLGASGASVGVADAHAVPALARVAGTHGIRFFAEAEPDTPLPAGLVPLDDALPERADPPPPPDVRNADVFLYIYTSGTTGYPKPAIVRHIRFTLGGIGLAALLGLQPGETVYAPLPLYHGESLFVGFAPAFRSGGAFASRRAFSASAFLDDVRRHEAVAFVYVGELCRYLLRQPPTPQDRDHKLRVAAGAGLRADVWRAFQERFGISRIIEMYGATEGNIALQNLDGRVGSVGKPYAEGQVVLARYDHARGDLARDDEGRGIVCGPDEPGELLGRIDHGGGTMEYDGYTDRAATERKIVRDLFAPGDAWFRSGDLLRRDADGYYYFVDRLGDTFRWKGENVATQEVADVLNGAPGVSESNVYGVTVPGAEGRAGMAALVLEPGAPFYGAALYAHAARNLPRYAMPAFVRLVAEMDVTGTLKQRKTTLASEGWDPARVQDPLYVRDDDAGAYVPLTAQVVAAIAAGRYRL
ncbi:MAG TPA: long-chain-acyl-CoA synthetase [Candidatus Limnocylindria bacterium]|nr:long-chain-acyl-CoA synthetase [Candidatus Limnocylindria bacterium]